LEKYCDTVANITVTVPDDVYDAARLRAAEARTSVSALVRDYLIRIAAQGSEFERLTALQQTTLTQIRERRAGYSASGRLSRDEVHDRDALR
jgi:plasmid stability protein